VIAGGHGRRIGGAKATVELAGRALISYSLAAIEEAGLQPLVIAKPDTELPPLRCPVIREDHEPRHPLCGVLTALELSEPSPLVILSCDMPFVPAALLAWLAAQPEPLVAPALDGRILPFPGRSQGSLRAGLEAALAEESSMHSALSRLSPRLLGAGELTAFGDPARICLNVNTASDLAHAEALLSEANEARG
jgi:molybdopterin-guanine dinucleotide biosynthesis protein A